MLSTYVYQSNIHDDDSVSIDIATKEDVAVLETAL